ncbi:glycosyl hydrolase family 28-related protein [Sinorhizobium meliloti]|uniref:glycosyl hydrolase family 28-related protein n=1 Tax=Rhizobium meliloti TaxID=382 RepID=UPI000FD92ABF|nr:glycosyl hydrolase family 28-related protein [Sinorhizobium meliloti]RVH21428.1 hypothetical protein CN216_00200 [Sinorhizobium meliloti]RVH21489.1 hypothetical protein CN216_00520 [Sinorhizobium meliloti]
MASISIDRTDGLNSAAAIKGPCRVATTANISLSGLQAIDGVTVAADDRVLVKDQTAGSENGIYVVDTGAWRRSKDFNKTKDVVKGTTVFVTDGTVNAETLWAVTTNNPIVIGTTSIAFSNDVLIPPDDSVGPDQITNDFIIQTVATRTAMKAINTSRTTSVYLKETGREGVFKWTTGDFSSHIAADTQEGAYVKAAAHASTVGAWVRKSGAVASGWNVKWFGATGDGAADDTAAFLGAISLMTAISGDLYVPQGSYRISSTLSVPSGSVIIGEGRGYEFNSRTKLLFIGTGTKSYTVTGATATTVANPDVGAAYLGDSGTRGDAYSTLDLTVSFSAAIILGKGSGLKGLGIFPNFTGVAGYAGTTGGLSDEWDVGVWARNSDWWNIEDCNVIGHWRKAALLVTAHDIGDGNVPSNEIGHAVRSHFQGFRGVSIRSPETVVGSNWGFAGTDFVNCLIRGLWHQSGHLATSSQLTTPFSSPSGCMEISGDIMRGVQFLNCTLIGRDDFNVFFGKCSEIQFDGCYVEGKGTKVSGSSLANSEGTRMIATSDSVDVTFQGNSLYVVDMSPNQTLDSSLAGQRYSAASGVFSPSTSTDDDYMVRRFASYVGHRFRKSTDRYIFEDETGGAQIIFDALGRIQSKLQFSGTVTVADDAAASIPAPKNGGQIEVTYCGATENGAFPDVTRGGKVAYDVGTSLQAEKQSSGGANFAAVSTDVSGTTGVDGNVTVGVIAGNVRIENRSGASAVFRYTFLG